MLSDTAIDDDALVTRAAPPSASIIVPASNAASALTDGRDIHGRAFAAARIGVWQCDLASDALAWTDTVYEMFGIEAGTSLDRNRIVERYRDTSRQDLDRIRSQAIAERSGFQLDAEIEAFDGQQRWIRITATVENRNTSAIRLFGMKQDITEEKRLADRNRYLAEFDVMTGLANRSRFEASLSALVSRPPRRKADREASVGALMLVDLDGFKAINDTYGHPAGDACLRVAAERLRSVFADAESVSRIGGDEFGVIFGHGVSAARLEEAGRCAVDILERPVEWGGTRLALSASVGIACAGAVSETELFAHADMALYRAKAAGRNAYRLYVPAMSRQSTFRLVQTVQA